MHNIRSLKVKVLKFRTLFPYPNKMWDSRAGSHKSCLNSQQENHDQTKQCDLGLHYLSMSFFPQATSVQNLEQLLYVIFSSVKF